METKKRWVAVVKFQRPQDRDNPAKLMRTYEYLMPAGTEDVRDEVRTFGVVCVPDSTFGVVCVSGSIGLAGLRIVKIVEIKPATEQDYDGRLKPLIAVFGLEAYREWTKRLERRAALLTRAERMISERSKIAQLEALAGRNPEANEVLAELKKMDEEDAGL